MVVRKSAFTMIELIFSIVVIAIAVMSLPVMTQTTDDNIESNVVQEAIFASEAILAESAAYYWDARAMDDFTGGSDYARVVNTAADCNATFQRPGQINRRCINDLTLGALNDTNSSAINSIASTGGKIITNHDSSTATETYKQDYTANVTVTYCTAGCIQLGDIDYGSDLKQITITVFNENGDTVTVLRSYVANIGEVAIQPGNI